MKKIIAIMMVALLAVEAMCLTVTAGSIVEDTVANGKTVACVEFLDFKEENNIWAKQNADGSWDREDITMTPADDNDMACAAYLDPKYYKSYTTSRNLVWALENNGEVLHVKADGTSNAPGLPFMMDSYAIDITAGKETSDNPGMEYCKIRIKNPSTADQFTMGFVNSNTNGGSAFMEYTITDIEVESNTSEWKTYIFSMSVANANTNYKDALQKDENGNAQPRWGARLKDIFVFPFGYGVTDGTGSYKGAEMYIDYIVFGSEKYVTEYKSELELKEDSVTALSLNKAPDKTSYYVGDKVDLSGMQLVATYADGTKEELDAAAPDVIYNFNEETASSTVTIKYGAHSQTFNVKVTGIKEVKVSTAPTTTTYDVKTVKSGFSPTGLEITVTYNDGHEATFGLGAFVLGDVNIESLGEQSIDVNFYGAHTSFVITLINVTSIKVDALENAVRFGDKISADNLTITCVYSDGSEKSLSDSGLSTNDVTVESDTKTPGTTTVSVKLTNATYAIDCSAETTATVETPKSLLVETIDGAKTTYNVGENLDTSGYKVSYVYDDGSTVVIKTEDYKTRYDFGEPGDKTVVFTDNYANLSANYTVKVEGSAIISTPKATTKPASSSGGCGSVIGAGAIVAAVAVIGSGIVIVKKKEN
ncbi:MAG: bacterial Ig-like domain-containing protein [Clostridia bacterium]|nr:bacterial Ig-like domain-containing protein [Clostridia bacterium]